MIRAAQGTRDILPPESAVWQHVEQACRKVLRLYNFHEIRTPVFETTDLFSRGVGEDTDIVSKEMFTWTDGGRLNHQLMLAAWLEKHPGYTETQTEVPDESSGRIDAVVILEGTVALLEFKGIADSASLARLRTLVDAYQLSRPGFNVRGILVVPYRRTQAGILSQEENVEIELLQGDFTSGGQRLTLRPENTAGVVRAYIERGLADAGRLQKLYYIGPQFRRERPQKGRYRQFYQIGAEVIGPPWAGSESPIRDAEVIAMLGHLLHATGLRGWTLLINSIGCADDRAAYNAALRNALALVKDKMCVDCQRRAETNPLRVFDCKVPEDQDKINDLPRISSYLDEPCREHFREVQRLLTSVDMPYRVDDRLVRGLDYYTRTTFEFTHGRLGAQSALLGGGRYDGLSEALGGPKAPGVGFALGLDRLVLALQEEAQWREITPPESKFYKPARIFVIPFGRGTGIEAIRIIKELRNAGLSADVTDESSKIQKSLEKAGSAGGWLAVIVGEDEVQSNFFTVRELRRDQTLFTGQKQQKVPLSGLVEFLRLALKSKRRKKPWALPPASEKQIDGQ